MTNHDLVNELKKTGKMYGPVMSSKGIVYLPIEKNALIELLEHYAPSNESEWKVGSNFRDGRKLIAS